MLMKLLFSKLVWILLPALLLAGLMPDHAGAQKLKAIDSLTRDMGNRETDFAFKLFGEITRQNSTGNILISPFSAFQALAMTFNGAEKETFAGMAEVLGLDGMEKSQVNHAILNMTQAMTDGKSTIELNVANSIWSRSGLNFRPEFYDTVTKYYQADLRPITTEKAINDWVVEKTNGKIRNLIDKIKPQDIMFLINAVYFKGAWKSKFDPKRTQERDFTLYDGSLMKVPMMTQNGEFPYYHDPELQAITLPYGSGQLVMYIFLPIKSIPLSTFIGKLTPDYWNKLMEQMARARGDITMPKFKMEYKMNLNTALENLGMGAAFSAERADFSGMYKYSGAEKVFISDVIQKAFIEVNEEGTEAAAATSVTMALTSVMAPVEPFNMVIDHPFFYAIGDTRTGAVLFMGIMTDPR
jgi:serine protease inhibitor